MLSRTIHILSLVLCAIYVTVSTSLNSGYTNSRIAKPVFPSRLRWTLWSGTTDQQPNSLSDRAEQDARSFWAGSLQKQTSAVHVDRRYQNDRPEQSSYNGHNWKKRLASCKNGNRFLKKKIKTMKLKYKEKLQTIKNIISGLFEDALRDPSAPLKDFCVVKNDVVKTSAEALLNDGGERGGGAAAGGGGRGGGGGGRGGGGGEKNYTNEAPCELSTWGEWNTLAFNTLERSRVILTEGCGCPPPIELVQRFDVRPYLGNNTSEIFQNPQNVGNNFDNDFLSGGMDGSKNESGSASAGQHGSGNGGSSHGNNNGNGNGGSSGVPGSEHPGTNSKRGKVRDILMVLDSSGSIDSDDFDYMKEGLVSMIDLFCDGFGQLDTNNRLAIVQFASNVTIIHYFRESQRPEDLKAKVMNLRHYKGNTCTGNALKKSMREIFTTVNGMRDFTIKDTLIVTDGKSNCGVNITKASLGLQRTSNVYALGVGIAGNARARSEVKSVVSNENPRHIFSLAKFQDFKSMVENLKRRHERHDPCAPIEEA